MVYALCSSLSGRKNLVCQALSFTAVLAFFYPPTWGWRDSDVSWILFAHPVYWRQHQKAVVTVNLILYFQHIHPEPFGSIMVSIDYAVHNRFRMGHLSEYDVRTMFCESLPDFAAIFIYTHTYMHIYLLYKPLYTSWAIRTMVRKENS